MYKKIAYILLLFVGFSSCSIFKKNDKVGCPINVNSIGAEKLMVYEDPNYKPKNAKERAEKKAIQKQLKKDAKADKKGTIY
ncbi:MAG: hypothetical protein ACOVQE_01955 [Chitinophagaceae bacterium]